MKNLIMALSLLGSVNAFAAGQIGSCHLAKNPAATYLVEITDGQPLTAKVSISGDVNPHVIGEFHVNPININPEIRGYEGENFRLALVGNKINLNAKGANGETVNLSLPHGLFASCELP